MGYEAIGIVDSRLPTIGVWAAATATDSPQAAVVEGSNIRAGEHPGAGVGFDTKPPVSASTAPTSPGYGKGVVFYMRDDTVVGVLLWNVFNKIPAARKVIRSQKRYCSLHHSTAPAFAFLSPRMVVVVS